MFGPELSSLWVFLSHPLKQRNDSHARSQNAASGQDWSLGGQRSATCRAGDRSAGSVDNSLNASTGSFGSTSSSAGSLPNR
jgi:hypothetical protein